MNEPHLEESIFGAPSHAAGEHHEPVSRRQIHHARPPRRKGRLGRLLALLLALAVVGGGTYVAWPKVRSALSGLPGMGPSQDEIDFAGPGEGEVMVTINKGDTGEQIATTLKAVGVVKTRTAYLNAVKADPDSAGKIQVGKYRMLKGMTGLDAFKFLIDPGNRVTNAVTVREGLWASETFEVLSKATGRPLAEYTKAAKDTKALGLPPAAKGNLEGWLFPATYEFDKSTPAAAQLKAMVAQAVSVMTKVQPNTAKWEETMILGSIIQAEAGPSHDMGKIARVFLNRTTTKGETYGLLQSDATVSYGVKRRSVTTTDAERADPNPWNTYKYPGFPKGPISNPGEEALTAAAKPADGPWFFFVATNPSTGETKFAVTYNEHLKNVEIFQQWCKDNPGNC